MFVMNPGRSREFLIEVNPTSLTWISDGRKTWSSIFFTWLFFHVTHQKWQRLRVICVTLHRKFNFSIRDFFSRFDQIRCFLRIWSRLLKKSLIQKPYFLHSVTSESTHNIFWSIDVKKWREKGLRSSLEAYFCNFPKHQKCLRTLGKLETDLHRKNCMFLGTFKSMGKAAVIRNIDTEIH